jgi:hypothetical protein
MVILTFAAVGAFAAGICPSSSIKGDLESGLSRGYCDFKEGNLQGAKSACEATLKQYPGNPVALNNLGCVAMKEGNYGKACGYFQEAMPKARGYRMQVNSMSTANDLCTAVEPYRCGTGACDLGPIAQTNYNMARTKLEAERMPMAGYPGESTTIYKGQPYTYNTDYPNREPSGYYQERAEPFSPGTLGSVPGEAMPPGGPSVPLWNR